MSFCYFREYFDTFNRFYCFWALDMAPIWAGAGLFSLHTNKFVRAETDKNDDVTHIISFFEVKNISNEVV